MDIAGRNGSEPEGGVRTLPQDPGVLGSCKHSTAAKLRGSPGRMPELTADVEFLAHHGIPDNILQLATRLATIRGTVARQELFAIGFNRERYWSTLAAELSLPFLADLTDVEFQANSGLLTTESVRHATSVFILLNGRKLLVLAPGSEEIAPLRERLRASPDLADRLAIAAPETIRASLVARRHKVLTHYAVHRLAHVFPRLSARRFGQGGKSQPVLIVATPLFAIATILPLGGLETVGLLLTVFFMNCSYWKLRAAFSRPRPLRLESVSSERLPTYSVLVPLYKEASVIPDLVTHLLALDYPASKLQILLVLEEDDDETRRTVAQHARAPIFDVIAVPPGGPRTKPKALTYALSFARGEFVAVFDAEDRPEPDQLRKAAAAFREERNLGCVQARLVPDNEDSWLARMFTLEYAANFQVLLPALASWRVPLPLGGTSNHFPRAVLEKVGGWDPYNVTEDADLGIRLARFGYQSVTILSHTFEEAPVALRQWLPQRRRWVKGWMQTSIVCLGRMPRHLRLPLRERLAVHGILTGGVLGLLLYPASLVALILFGSALAELTWPDTVPIWILIALNLGNFLAIMTAAAVSTLRGLRAAGAVHLAPLIPLLPFYWALMSLAAWQALFQFLRNRFAWEKTAHGIATGRRRTPVSSSRF